MLGMLIQGLVFGQLIDKSVATYKLTKTEIITLKQFQRTIAAYEQRVGRAFTAAERKQFLEQLIDEKLVLQAAGRDGVTVTDGEVKQSLQQIKLVMAEMQLGTKISDDQFMQLIKAQEAQSGVTWDDLMEEVESQALIQKYVQQKQGALLKSVKEPSESEIQDYYDENRANFISPEMMRIKQLVVITQGMPGSVTEKYKAKIDDIYAEITKKGASLDQFSDIYIEGQSEKIGGLSIGIWQRDDEKNKAIYGKDFYTKLFKMKDGALSAVIKSNVGYHIVQILEKIPFKTLALEDKIPPKNVSTVREQIKVALAQQNANELYQQASAALVKEIRKTAMVKIYDENLAW
jgi:parvulin-like peptidyl-prolyl isomerase